MTQRAFVAGATGYTGREVVRICCERDVDTIAHIRPGSSKLERDRELFEEYGATVDTTAWEDDAMTEAMRRHRPTVVFGCLGTTRARKRAADPDERDDETYEAVDYGLTKMLALACVTAEIEPKFVYVSAIGVKPNPSNAYMKARWKAENYLRHSPLPWVFARPSFISGDNREESRPLERFGAVAGDVVLGALGSIGFKDLRDKYASLTNTQLATALVELALDDDAVNVIAEADELRSLAE
jgi:uncharacterized protein YbjT (DUF2867 family)